MSHGGAYPRVVLLLGALIGAALAGRELVSPPRPATADVPADVPAVVNGVSIGRDRFQRAVDGLTRERERPLSAEERRRVLDRLIDEELLHQRALELGLDRSDPRIRGELVASMIATAVEAADGPLEEVEIDEDAARAHFLAHPARFTAAPRLVVEHLFFHAGSDGAGGLPRATAARQRLERGDPWAEVRALADDPIIPLPAGPLSPATLREYLGPTVTRALLELSPGELTAPVRSGGGVHVVRLVESVATAPATAFADVREHVVADMRRDADDHRLRAYLDGLRQGADIRVRDGAP